jgi:hypothetical protein
MSTTSDALHCTYVCDLNDFCRLFIRILRQKSVMCEVEVKHLNKLIDFPQRQLLQQSVGGQQQVIHVRINLRHNRVGRTDEQTILPQPGEIKSSQISHAHRHRSGFCTQYRRSRAKMPIDPTHLNYSTRWRTMIDAHTHSNVFV